MTTTLQEALIKAGLVKREKVEEARRGKPSPKGRGGHRPPQQTEKKSVGFLEGKHHHHIRAACESCEKTSPDVEYYEHRNQVLPKWLCVECADRSQIEDKFRQTVQSQHAQSGRFRRQYGPTKLFK